MHPYENDRQLLKALAATALQLADPYQAVCSAWSREPLQGAIRVLAIGKAAAAMWRAVADCCASGHDTAVTSKIPSAADQALLPTSSRLTAASDRTAFVRAALIIAPEPLPAICASAPVESATVCQPEWHVAAHPVPDARSVQAGERALRFVGETAADETLLVLLSGGASSLCEALPADFSLQELQQLQRALLASALDIGQINAIRQQLSRIKGGGLLAACPAHSRVRQWLISDVPGHDADTALTVIGSAPFVPVRLPPPDWSRVPTPWRHRLQQRWQDTPPAPSAHAESRIVSSNHAVRERLQQQAATAAIPVLRNEAYAGDCAAVANHIAACLQHGPPGLYLFGGECHLQLPPAPGRGGRNQHLALCLQQRLVGQPGISLLCLASDGVDGQSDAAGALFQTTATDADAEPAIAAALAHASSYDYWSARGGLLFTGATGANVADLVIGWKAPAV